MAQEPKMTPDDLLYLGQIYGGDHEITSWGQTYWKFVIVNFKGSTYVLENYPSQENGKNVLLPVIKKLSL